MFGARCAQITPLTGGKKDTEPPKVIRCEPQNASVNFNSNDINLQFDEYIQLKNVVSQLIMTPQPKEFPEIEAHGKSISIKLKDTLQRNTTYKLAFGNSISDLHESNALQDFEYVFSTGHHIDSLMLRGSIITAFDKKPATNVLVGLYPAMAKDSAIYKDKPFYISKTNERGEFQFSYLPDAFFKLVGINDRNKNLLYDGSEEEIAFTKTLVNPKTPTSISLSLFKEPPHKSFIKQSLSTEYGKAIIVYNKPQTDIKAVHAKGLVSYALNQLKDTLAVYYSDVFDTLKTCISYTSKKADTLSISILSAEAFEKLNKNKTIKYDLQSNINQIFPVYDSLSFKLNFPITFQNIHEQNIHLAEKIDTVFKKIPFHLSTRGELATSFKIETALKQETTYRLTFARGALSNHTQRVNDSITYVFKTTSMDDYAQLKLKLFFPKKENYIVMLFNDKEQLIDERWVDFSLTSTSEKIISYNYLLPGNYLIKVVEDANKNGLFDAGNYFSGKQPEAVFVNTTPIKLLAGWEIENEWIVE